MDATKHVTDGFPPAFLMTSTGDFLQKEAVKMAQVFTERLVPFELHFYGDKQNLLGHVFHCDMRSEDAKICNDDECAFFKRFC